MEHARAAVFAKSWADAWNSHDLEKILGHFSEGATFRSPIAKSLMPESGGVLVGKQAIRAYWRSGLDRIPDLHFTVLALYTGLESLVINYENQTGSRVSEILHFEDDLVVHGEATYELDDVRAASGVRS